MAKRMSAKDARSKFSDLLGSVNYGGEEVIVERSGRPVAAVIPVPVYERLVDLLKPDTILVPGRAAIKGAVLQDPRDEMFLACAIEASADCIVRQEGAGRAAGAGRTTTTI